uniref:Transmembrane 9 superfamily member n=1 Tax=Aegilops tauschii TaxID=37682 RepID=M8AH52_AEGTA
MASPSTSTIFSTLLLFLMHFNTSPATAFYLPGSYPHRYLPGEALAAKVNSLTSPSSKLPFPYYSLPLCAPQGGVNRAAESLGELLLGDRIETSPYRFSMLTNSTAALFLCRTDPVSPAAADLIRSRIDDAYHVNLLLDTLPVVRHPVLLCVMVGDGVRILGMGVVTILFAALGFMSPASRGALVTGMLCLYLVLGLAAGYTSVRLWKTVRHGDSSGWKAVAWRASFVFPGIGFSVFTALNCVLWYNGSTGAVPFALFVVLILLWFFVSVPLTLAGGLLASRVRGHVEYPVKTNKIARQGPAAQCSPWVFVAIIFFLA